MSWERLSKPGDKCSTHWRHDSGWEVQHCGHPTANWPYLLVDPEGNTYTSWNRLGFRGLRVGRDVVAAILAGVYEKTDDGRVLYADGRPLEEWQRNEAK